MNIKELRKIYMTNRCTEEELEQIKKINLKGTEPNYRFIVKQIIKRQAIKTDEAV